MIHIIYFDINKVSAEEAVKAHQQVCEIIPDGDTVITIPLGLSWIPDYPLDELKNFRNYLTEIIEKAEEKQNDL